MGEEIPDSPRVEVYPSRREMGAAAGHDVAAELRARLGQSDAGRVRMIFAAAPSQQEMLDTLAGEAGIDWSRVTAFHMDEYIGLPDDAPQRFGVWLHRALFDRVPFGEVYIIEPGQDPEAECERYARLLAEAQIDIVCLGIGDNGHLAFNDPPYADLEDPRVVRVVELDARSRVQQVEDGLFAEVDEVPTHALTLTIPTLLSAERLFCVVPGERKRAAVTAALAGPVGADCPASALQTHPACTLYLDQEAAPRTELEPMTDTRGRAGTRRINALGTIVGRDPSSGRALELTIQNETIVGIRAVDLKDAELPWLVPGYVDLQVNGYGGHDVNGPDVDAQSVAELVDVLAHRGTTTFVPTVITGSEEAIIRSLRAVAKARQHKPAVARAVPFVHVEGPFIAEEDGPRGAHDLDHVRPPSLDELDRWQEACGGLVGIATISPHHAGSVEFTSGAVARGVRVAVGHTSATPAEIATVVDAGASLSTHLGNGAHAVLARHPNYIWAQLADDRLDAGFIADGHHLPGDTLKAMLRAKGLDRSFLVSDSVALGGMPAGSYESPVGGNVELSEDGRLSVAGTPYLAGAVRSLAECVATAVEIAGITVADAVRLATSNPARQVPEIMCGRIAPGRRADVLLLNPVSAEVVEVFFGGTSLPGY